MQRQASRLLLTGHVAASVAVFGMELVQLALGIAGARGIDPREVYPPAHLMAQWLMAPLALVSLATGLLLVAGTGRGLLRPRWVGVKLAITATLTVLVFALLVPGLGRMADAATSTTAAITAADHARFVIIPAAGAALLALNTALGIYKPDGRAAAEQRAR